MVNSIKQIGKTSESGKQRNPSRIPKGRWQLQVAKARFSEVFRRARTEGPQWVTKQDKEAVVILPAEEYEKLTARAKQPHSLVQFFRESPLAGSGINLEREPDYGRDVDL